MQNAKNMTENFKFVYVMFLFIFLFIVTTEVGGKSSFHPFQFSFFSLYFVLNLLPCFSNIVVLSFSLQQVNVNMISIVHKLGICFIFLFAKTAYVN